MSDTENTKKRPTHTIWMVTGNGTGFWTRIGAGWLKDSGNISLRLDCVPLAECRIMLKEITEGDDAREPAGEQPSDEVSGEGAGDPAPAAGGKRKGGQK